MPVIWDIWISHLHRSRKWNSNSLGLERLGKGSPCLMVWRLILCVTLLGCSEIWSSITLGASVRVFGGNINIWTGRPSKADSLPWTGLVTPVEGLHRATPAWLTCSSVVNLLNNWELKPHRKVIHVDRHCIRAQLVVLSNPTLPWSKLISLLSPSLNIPTLCAFRPSRALSMRYSRLSKVMPLCSYTTEVTPTLTLSTTI